ncbi:uncharacterized protein LOC114575695 [Exaiptasia diaphana]|uniref:Uncharacterized protein n=1 Tax=Exaiptasia diaphana TaxID=2652724 RepID=A0A913YQW1_EXADI|nr:uncharacterized protein LOC114575695 [Exaiptasia diaphana]
MEGASRNVADFYNNVAALGEFSKCMDPQFKDIKNWELFAFGLDVPADVIRICKLYSEYSPTIRLFQYLSLTHPNMTVSDLKAVLTRNKQRARFDLYRLLKGTIKP